MLGFDEPATSEASAPLVSTSALTAVASEVRLLLNPANKPAWMDRSVCCCCHPVRDPLDWLRIALTTDLTSMPFPFSRDAALKLIAIFGPLYLCIRSRNLAGGWNFCPRSNSLQQFLALVDAAQLFGAWHLQDHVPRLFV